MADQLPQNFAVPQEGAISTYNYQDIADGSGKVTFYGAKTESSTGATYLLSDQVVYSEDVEVVGTNVACASGTWAKSFDVDFDAPAFNTPRTMQGKAYFSVPLYSSFGGGSGGSHSRYVIIKVRKWNGTTETELFSVQSPTETKALSTGDGTISKIHLIPLTITETHFKIGETLRITVEGWVMRDVVDGTAFAVLGCDPTDRDGTYLDNTDYTTQIKFIVPFKIEL